MPNPNLPIAGNFNTYVGARYVPKFAEPMEWNQNTLYEPLTIVSYQGNSYTSKTFPPIGTVPTNETYWAPTGNYNAQIEQYRNEVAVISQGRPYKTEYDFNFKCDGSDEGLLLQNALNNCAQNNYIFVIRKNKTISWGNSIILPSNLIMVIEGNLFAVADTANFTTITGNPQPGYTGMNNIIISGNGIIDGNARSLNSIITLFRFYHSQNIIVQGITIQNYGTFHAIEIGGCQNVTINNTLFKGANLTTEEKPYVESAIQIEPCSSSTGQSGAIPYDNTPCNNITIKYCTFDKDNYSNVDSAISSEKQGGVENDYWHTNISITNNNFLNLTKGAIYPYRWKNAVIQNNYAYKCGDWFIGIISPSSSENIYIVNNIVEDCGLNLITSPTSVNICPIYVSQSSKVYILNNEINKAPGYALYLNSVTDFLISNNTAFDISYYNITANRKITNLMLILNCSDGTISNNIIFRKNEDTFVNGVIDNNAQLVNIKAFNNYFKPYLYVSSDNNLQFSNPLIPLYNETILPTSTVVLSSISQNYPFLVIKFDCDGVQFSKIAFNYQPLNFSYSYVSGTQAYVYYMSLTLLPQTHSITFNTGNKFEIYPTPTMTVGTVESSPVKILGIYAYNNPNYLHYDATHNPS